MLKILVISIFLLVTNYAYSQGGYLRPNNSFGDIRFRISSEKELRFPTAGASLTPPVTQLRQAGLQYDTVNHLLFVWRPEVSIWDTIPVGSSTAGGGGGSGTLITFKDTTVTFDGTFSSFSFATGLASDPTSISIKTDKVDGEGYFKQYDAVTKRITISYGLPPLPQSPATSITIKYTAALTQ